MRGTEKDSRGPKRFMGIIAPKVVTAYASDGALTIADGVAKLTKATAGAYTIADPTAAQEGTVMIITSQTAAAHTVTYSTTGFNGAGTSGDVATFGGAIGDCLVIVAINAKWNVISAKNVTLA